MARPRCACSQAVEAAELNPLPRTVFVLASWSRATVGPDIHVKVGKSLYSVPWRLIGQQGRRPRHRHDGAGLLPTASWSPPTPALRAGQAHRLRALPAGEDRVPRCAPRPGAAPGPARSARTTAAVIAELLAVNALFRLRAAQGVLGLRDKYGDARLEAACGKALAVGDPTYRTIKGILAAGARNRPAASQQPATAAPRRSCTDPTRLFANVVPLPSTDAGDGTAQATNQSTARGRGVGMSIVDPALHQCLRTLKLSGMLDTLDARLAQARAGDLGHLEFLQVLCHDEITRRETVAMTRRIRRARFEQQATLGRLRLHRQPETARRADPRPGRAALARRRRVRDPVRPGRGRENPRRPGPRPPRHPPRRRRPLRQDQPRAGRPRRRPRRPHLGHAASPNSPARTCSSSTTSRMRELTATQADDLYELVSAAAAAGAAR